MSIGWDPKITGLVPKQGTSHAEEPQSSPKRAPITPEAMERPAALPGQGRSIKPTHPLHHTPQPAQPYEAELSSVRASLRGTASEIRSAAEKGIRLAMSFRVRRHKAGRAKSLALLAEIAGKLADKRGAARCTQAALEAEALLHELSPTSTTAACAALMRLLDEEPPTPEGLDKEALALARAVLSQALVQLATHFPLALDEAEITPQQALEHALVLAEEAILLAPELPDGHAALARVLACHDDYEALDDAALCIERALSLDEDHDPAAALAAMLDLESGRAQEALARVEQLQRRGNSLPHIQLLRALCLEGLGRNDEASRELERALRTAPDAGLLWADGARLATQLGQGELAKSYSERARALLGPGAKEATGVLTAP